MKTSAGLVIYNNNKILLVHPGGPYWKEIDEWSIPKGEIENNEDPLETALREAKEELGQIPNGKITLELGTFKQSKHKKVIAFGFKGKITLPIHSNVIKIEYPKGSGKEIEIPEVDKAEWLLPEIALQKIHKGQRRIIDKFLLEAPFSN